MQNNKMHFSAFFGLVMLGAASVANATLPIQHWKTPSGASVLYVENHDMPMVDFKVEFAAGSSYDTRAVSGLAGMTRHLMPLGAGKMSEDQISSKLADMGVQMGGDFDRDLSAFSLRTLTSETAPAVEILASIIEQPVFDEKVLEREKSRQIAVLKDAEMNPGHLAEENFTKMLYGNHPYALQPEGTIDTVKSLTRDEMVDFYRKHYTAGREVISIVGDISRQDAEKAAAELSGHLGPDVALPAIPEVANPAAPETKMIPYPSSQSHILIGYPGVKRDDPDYFPLLVGNYVLGGGGFESRLLNEVREKRGLAYSVYSYFFPLEERGPFKVGLQTRKDQTQEALSIVMKTIDDFVKNGPTEKDLVAAKENLVGGFPLRIDSNAKILDYLGMIGFYHLPLTYLDDFTNKVNAVTVEDIRDAFARRIDPSKMVTVVVGAPGG